MIALLQRVSEGAVTVAGETVGEIGPGLVVLVGVERGDGPAQAERLVERILGYRVFPDSAERMNRSLHDTGGGLLLVPQFTLAADTRKGTRASFTTAAAPETGERLYRHLVDVARACHADTHSGRFGADMHVRLVNDGPVTFWLRAAPDDSN